ncbi:hypothetical protein JYT31_01210 [Beggiatoa alba]|nr:hypothetical protein [Beggiatoa alba]
MRVIATFLILYLMGLGILHAYRILFENNVDKRYHLYLLLFIPLLFYLYTIATYLNVDTFRQHVEPTMVIQAQLIAAGQGIYTELNAADRFSLQYGPTTYIITAFFVNFFDNPILGSKIYGIVMSLFGLAILFYTIRRKFTFQIAFMGIVYCVLAYLLLAEISFRNQADSLLLFSVIIAIAGLFYKQKYVSIFLLSFGIALAVNAKAHAVLYFMPIVYLYFYYHGKKNIYGIVILTALFTGSIFLLPQFDLYNYLIWLSAATKHGFSIALFGKNIAISLLFVFPAILLYKIGRSATNDAAVGVTKSIEAKAFKILILSMVLVSTVASKNGAGIHHILPFTPIIVVFIAFFLSDLDKEKLKSIIRTREKSVIVFILILAWLFAMGADIVKEQKQYFKFIQNEKGSGVFKEISSLKEKYGNYVMLMGYSNAASYKPTYYRPMIFSPMQGNVLDPVALMDMELSGMEIPESTIQKFVSQVFDIVLIPKGGKPFSMKNSYYPNRPLFGDAIPKVFLANYILLEQSLYFEVWASKRIQSQLIE